MAHKVLIGGFGSGRSQMRRTAESLSRHFDEDVRGVPFAEANANPVRLAQAVKGAEVYTHSAGMTTLRHTSPEAIHGIAPPLRARPAALVGRAAVSVMDGLKEARDSAGRRRELSQCSGELLAELTRHFHGHFRHLGSIAAFDAIQAGADAKSAGIRVGLGFMSADRLFIPTEGDLQRAKTARVPLAMLEGDHLGLLCSPEELMAEYHRLFQMERQKYDLAV